MCITIHELFYHIAFERAMFAVAAAAAAVPPLARSTCRQSFESRRLKNTRARARLSDKDQHVCAI